MISNIQAIGIGSALKEVGEKAEDTGKEYEKMKHRIRKAEDKGVISSKCSDWLRYPSIHKMPKKGD